jgi:hypothetical protein
MTAAYILAGELKEADGDYQTAFRNYENLFWPFVIRKQRAAKRFSRSFAPRTRFGIFARNQVTRLASLPFVTNLAMGRLIRRSIGVAHLQYSMSRLHPVDPQLEKRSRKQSQSMRSYYPFHRAKIHQG